MATHKSVWLTIRSKALDKVTIMKPTRKIEHADQVVGPANQCIKAVWDDIVEKIHVF